jgi:hypothetical protein
VNGQRRPTDSRLAPEWDSFQKTYLDLQRYRTLLASQATDPKAQGANSADQRDKEMTRVTLDIARLSVACRPTP